VPPPLLPRGPHQKTCARLHSTQLGLAQPSRILRGAARRLQRSPTLRPSSQHSLSPMRPMRTPHTPRTPRWRPPARRPRQLVQRRSSRGRRPAHSAPAAPARARARGELVESWNCLDGCGLIQRRGSRAHHSELLVLNLQLRHVLLQLCSLSRHVVQLLLQQQRPLDVDSHVAAQHGRLWQHVWVIRLLARAARRLACLKPRLPRQHAACLRTALADLCWTERGHLHRQRRTLRTRVTMGESTADWSHAGVRAARRAAGRLDRTRPGIAAGGPWAVSGGMSSCSWPIDAGQPC